MTSPHTENRTRRRSTLASGPTGTPDAPPANGDAPASSPVNRGPAATSEEMASTGVDLSALPEVVELNSPRDGVPLVIANQEGLERAAAALAAGSGPAAVDAERASGFRYGQRAFLVQIRREGAGTWLIDPEPFED